METNIFFTAKEREILNKVCSRPLNKGKRKMTDSDDPEVTKGNLMAAVMRSKNVVKQYPQYLVLPTASPVYMLRKLRHCKSRWTFNYADSEVAMSTPILRKLGGNTKKLWSQQISRHLPAGCQGPDVFSAMRMWEIAYNRYRRFVENLQDTTGIKAVCIFPGWSKDDPACHTEFHSWYKSNTEERVFRLGLLRSDLVPDQNWVPKNQDGTPAWFAVPWYTRVTPQSNCFRPISIGGVPPDDAVFFTDPRLALDEESVSVYPEPIDL